jgi:response regulator RpfG family c-di-GMP phosphodiesterase
MATPSEKNFQDYKKTEAKALELMREMKSVSPKKADIELALLVAIFELHKSELNPAHITKIIHGHLEELNRFYSRGAEGN